MPSMSSLLSYRLTQSCWSASEHAVVNQPDNKKAERRVFFITEPDLSAMPLSVTGKIDDGAPHRLAGSLI